MGISETLEIIIKANDQTKGAFGGLQKTLGKLGGLGKVVGKVAIAGLGVAAGAAGVAVAGLGAGLKVAMDEAIEAESVMAQLDAVIASTGGAAGVSAEDVTGFSDKLATLTRYTDDEITSAQSLLLTFTNIGKDVFPDTTQAILDMSTAMGQDLQTSALQIGKAMNDPIKGMTALQRVGVSFTEGQIEMVKAMVEAGDTMGAQKFILAELTKEFGGSAAAAGDTLAGQMDILRNSMKNVAEEAGTSLIPILTEGLQNIAPVLIELANKLATFLKSDTFKQWLTDVSTFVTEKLIPALVDIGTFIEEKVIPALQNFGKWIRDTAIPAIQEFVVWAKENLIPMFQDMWNWLSINIPDSITTFANAWKENVAPNLQTSIDQWKNDLYPAFMTLKQILGTDLPPILAAFKENWQPIVEVFQTIQGLITWIIDGLGRLAEKMGAVLPGLEGMGIDTTGLGGGPRSGVPTQNAWTMPQTNQAYFPVIVNFNQPVLGFSDEAALADQIYNVLSRRR